MKAKKYVYLMATILAFGFVSCETEPGESCDGEDLSADFSCPASVDAVATFCSDGVNNSYYTYAGNDYYCTGVDANTCQDALNSIGTALIEAGCSSKKSGSIEAAQLKLSALAENLLQEVRTQSLSN